MDEITECPQCGSNNIEIVDQAYDEFENIEIQTVECKDCGCETTTQWDG